MPAPPLRVAAAVLAAAALGGGRAALGALVGAAVLRLDAPPRRPSPSLFLLGGAAASGVAFGVVAALGGAGEGSLGARIACLAFPWAAFVVGGPAPKPGPRREWGPFEQSVKRVVDWAGLLALAAPAVIALVAVRLLRDPLWREGFLYHQVRTGLYGRLILVRKVRTMPASTEADGRPRWSGSADAAPSPVGKVLRRFWLDEIPQLLDVAAGRISLVGPRPERPEFVEGLVRRLPKYALRLSVPQGITGPAQVMGFAGDTSLRKRLICDRRYAERWTPWCDLRILAATVRLAALKALGRRPD